SPHGSEGREAVGGELQTHLGVRRLELAARRVVLAARLDIEYQPRHSSKNPSQVPAYAHGSTGVAGWNTVTSAHRYAGWNASRNRSNCTRNGRSSMSAMSSLRHWPKMALCSHAACTAVPSAVAERAPRARRNRAPLR